MLIDIKIGPDLIFDHDGTGLAGEQLYFVLTKVDDMVRDCCRFLHGINAGFQIADQDLTVLICGTVQIVSAILDLADTEGHPFQRRSIRTELYNLQRRLDAVGEHKLSVLIGIQLNNSLCLVDNIAGTAQFRHYISTRRKRTQIDLTVFISAEFLWAVISRNRLDLKQHIGDDLGGIGAVHLDKPKPRLDIIEEHQFPDAITGFKFYLLRGRVEDMAITAGIHLHCPIGTGFHISQKDLTKLIGTERADRNAVMPDLKGNIGHGYHILAVIFDDSQARQFFVDQLQCSCLTGCDIGGVNGIVQKPSRRCHSLPNAVGTGSDLIEHGNTGRVCFCPVHHTTFDMCDLDHGSGQIHARIRFLFNTEIAIRSIFEYDLCNLTVCNGYGLHSSITQQIILRGRTLNHGITANNGHRDTDLTGRIRSIGAHRLAIGSNDLKHSTTQGNGGAGLIFYDLQASGKFILGQITVIAVGGKRHRADRIGVDHVVLQISILIHFSAAGIEDSVLIYIRTKGQLYVSAFPCDAVCGIQNLKLSGIAIPGDFGSNGCDGLIVHIHDPGTFGHTVRIGECNIDGIITDPCFGPECKYLLLVLSAVDGYIVSHITVRHTGNIGCQIFCPCRTTAVDILSCRKNLLRPLQLCACQIRIDLQVIDIPMRQQITPKRHFGGIVGLILIVQAKLIETAVRISAGNDTSHLRVRSLFLCEIFDTFASFHRLRNTLGVGVHTVGRNFLYFAGRRDVVIVSINLFPYTPIDCQIGHGIAAIVNIDLTKGFLF